MTEISLFGSKTYEINVSKFGRKSTYIVDSLSIIAVIKCQLKHAIAPLKAWASTIGTPRRAYILLAWQNARAEIIMLRETLLQKQKTIENQQTTILTLTDIKNQYICKCDNLQKYCDDLGDWHARSAQENASLYKQIETLTNELKKKNENECSAN